MSGDPITAWSSDCVGMLRSYAQDLPALLDFVYDLSPILPGCTGYRKFDLLLSFIAVLRFGWGRATMTCLGLLDQP